MSKITPGPWIYEESTKTIRAVPSNYWLASMDSFDGAVDHAANARLIAAVPALLRALEAVAVAIAAGSLEKRIDFENPCTMETVRAAIRAAKGDKS